MICIHLILMPQIAEVLKITTKMKKIYRVFYGLTFASSIAFGQTEPEMKHLSSYVNGVLETAEVVTYDAESQQAYFTNSSTNSFTIIDISNPNLPVKVKEVSLDIYGSGPNSIAANGTYVAIAEQAKISTDLGKVLLFDISGNFIKSVSVGALPDMLKFTHDGKKILVANEGEPNADYTVDPEGSFSIIDLSLGINNIKDTTITFTSFNNQKESLKNKGVRIFGNNGLATVAQDMEPEYIAVTENDELAYINCQENNALAVFNLKTMKFLDIQPLGYKDHMSGTPTIKNFKINELVKNWPSIGTPVYDGGQPEVMLGGFSGLYFDATLSNKTEMVFFTVPDRGPNGDPVTKTTVAPAALGDLRPYKLPDYQSRIVKFTINIATGAVTLDNQILLTRKDGMTPISGKGNIPGYDEVPVTYADSNTIYLNTDFTDAKGETYHALPYDEMGGDFEGIVKDKRGNFWLCDENRPALYNMNPNGVMIERYVPEGTSMLGLTPMPTGTYGAETLPAVYSKRRANRGFEAIAYDSLKDVVYAFIQSPIENPGAIINNKSDVIRILGIDALTGTPVEEYVYLLENNKYPTYTSSRVDKIGDAVYKGMGKFLVVERDSEGPNNPSGKKFVFEIDINKATNLIDSAISSFDGTTADKTLEQLSADDLVADSIRVVMKRKIINLPTVGYASSDKAEGIAILPNGALVVLNDNDFGLAGAGVTDATVAGIITFGTNYGFDASDKESAVNITSHPTLGMFLPDGIASYSVNGMDYIVTANEGDSRDYKGYSEETRVASLVLDSLYFPNAKDLQKSTNLGRLKTTKANGDYDGDGKYEAIYSYGGRSFSIFDKFGNLVYDSGDDFASIIFAEEEDLFNHDNGTKKGRSDDKGCEPEAIEIGTIDGKTYAFIGAERQSAIFVYDITDPKAPEFITYYSNKIATDSTPAGDLAPEILKFIPADESPNGKNLLLAGYEVSGSVGIIQIGDVITEISAEVEGNTFDLYPSPVVGAQTLKFNTALSGDLFDTKGQLLLSFDNVSSISTQNLNQGVYIIKTTNNGTKRFLKLD